MRLCCHPSFTACPSQGIWHSSQNFHARQKSPVIPGVFIIEGLVQTAGALCVHSLGTDYKAELVYFMSIDRAKFRRPVLPGDQIHYHVRKIRNRGRVWRFYGEAKVDGRIVAEAEVSAMLADTAEARAFAAGKHG